MNPKKHGCTVEKEGIPKTYRPSIAIEITITKGNQSISLAPEEYAAVSRRMENAFINSLVVLEE